MIILTYEYWFIYKYNYFKGGLPMEHKEHEHKHNHDEHSEHCSCSEHYHHHEHGKHCNCDEHHHHEHDEHCNCGEHHHHEHGKHCNCDEHHHHEHDEHCNCGEHHHHEHDEHCNCGEHHHEHDEHCNCGEHHHEHDEHFSCGGHHHHEHTQETAATRQLSRNGKMQVYILENLSCANCAAKMEKKINDLDYIEDAVITFATKQLRLIPLKDTDEKDLLPVLQEICSSIESEVKVVPRNVHKKNNKTSNHKHSFASNGEHHHEEHKHSGHNHEEDKESIWGIAAGAVIFVAGNLIKEASPSISLVLFVVAYIILGGKIVLTALKNLGRGHVFDENFLMSIATIGAFIIKEYPEAVGVMLFYRIGEYFEHVAVEKSRKQIMEAVDMRPEVVNLVSGDEITIIDAEEAEVGDILLVRPGDRIPLDGTIIEGNSRIDTSPVTGEPVPVAVKEGSSIISGCVNTSGLIKFRVDKPLEESMVTRILNSVENAAASKPKIDRFITRFARVYTPFVVAVAAATAILPSLLTGDWNYWVYTALTFLVISCPCALVLSVPLAFFSGIGAGSKKGILFKGGASLEAMNDVKAVVMDKTGTITEGNFIVQKVSPINNEDLKNKTTAAKPVSEKTLLSLCASAESTSTHPIAVSIVNAAKEKELAVKHPDFVEEIAGKGIKAYLAHNELLCGNKKLMKAFDVDLSAYQNETHGTEVLVALNGQYIGHIVIADTIKKNAASAITSIKKLGITTAMLTGDSEENANVIGKETGIQEIHAKLLPENKLEHLKKIRETHGAVMFVGDGINDAPVLAGADVGAAMGTGADAAIEAADVVFMTPSMKAIPEALSIARAATRISKQNVIFALAIKALVMVLGLRGVASMWMAVFADSGVAMLCVLNSIRILYQNK